MLCMAFKIEEWPEKRFPPKTASGSCGTTHGMFSYDDNDVVYSWNRMTSVRSVVIHSILSEMEFEMFFSILNGIL